MKYIIFRRINTGGEPLSPQEIRHALNQGKFLDMIKEFAKSVEFKNATDNGVSPRRMDDQECVLRFMAFTLSAPENYKEYDFDAFLNNIMRLGNKLSERERKGYSARFIRSMEICCKIFYNKAFRKFYKGKSGRLPVNKALFETVFVNIGNLDEQQQDFLVKNRAKVVEKLRKLIAYDKDFEASISQGTGSIKKVHYRFSAVKKILEEILNAD